MLSLFLAASLTTAAMAAVDSVVDFASYQAAFGKTYASEAEAALRRGIFESRLAEIRRHNKAFGSSYAKGVNALTDRTDSERAELLGRDAGAAFASRMKNNNNNNEGSQQQQPAKKTAKTKKSETETSPASLDWRERGIVSAVKNQGSCGSCWAHAATESIESYVALETGELPVLSVQQVVSCASNSYECGGQGGCAGSIAELAFTYAQLYGLALNESWPYVAETGTCDIEVNAAPYATVSGYEKLPENDGDAVLRALLDVGPLAVNVDASEWHDYASGVFDGCTKSVTKNSTDLNHVVQLVGYGTDDDSGLNYWLVRNSWGTSYGEDGYIKLLRAADGEDPTCSVDPTPLDGTGCLGGSPTQYVCGECGVLFDTSYPVGAQIIGA